MKQVLLILVWLLSSLAFAHPRDELVQAAYLSLTPTSIALELDLTAGDLVASAFSKRMDSSGDGKLEQSEAFIYAQTVLRQLRLNVDGQPVALEITDVTAPTTAALLAGGGVLQLKARADIPERPGAHTLEFENAHAPVKSGYLSNAFAQSERLQMNRQTRSDDQSQYRLEYTLSGTDDSSAGLWIVGTLVAGSSLALLVWRRRVAQSRSDPLT
jgi:nickel/cobalt transporter (NicO) family protein